MPDNQSVPAAQDAPANWLCGYVIEFHDGSEAVVGVLHVGTREECQRVADSTPDLRYPGTRPLATARTVVRPVPEGEQ